MQSKSLQSTSLIESTPTDDIPRLNTFPQSKQPQEPSFPPPPKSDSLYPTANLQFAFNADLFRKLEEMTQTLERLGEKIYQIGIKQRQLSLPFKIRKARSDGECYICRQTILKGQNTVKLNCRCKGYQHVRCISTWLKINHSCPICRKRFRIGSTSFLRR